MNDPNAILKEYLVSIGFDVDKSALDKSESVIGDFMSGIADMAGTAMKVVGSLIGALVAVDYQLRNLHFIELNTGSSIANVNALDSAIKSLGGSAASVNNSLGILNAARNGQNFQAQAYAGALGLDMSGDTTKEYMSAFPVLSKMLAEKNPLAGIMASTLGISMDTLYAYNNAPDKENFLKNFASLQKAGSSVDAEKAAQLATTATGVVGTDKDLLEINAVGPSIAGNQGVIAAGGLIDKTGILQNAPATTAQAVEGMGQAAKSIVSGGFIHDKGGYSSISPADAAMHEANRISRMTGIPADWLYAQFQHETGKFTNHGATSLHNYAGIEIPHKKGAPGVYKDFESDDKFGDYYAYLMRDGGLYPGARKARSMAEFQAALSKGGYHEDNDANYNKGMAYAVTHPVIVQTNHITVNSKDTGKVVTDAVAAANKQAVRNTQAGTH